MHEGIVIVGAGLGGLATALALHARGIACRVYEQAREVRELGVGLNLLPHGVRVLSELGLDEQLARTGIETRAIEYRSEFGELIYSDPRGRHAGFLWPHYSIHRGRLQMLLHDAVTARMGADAVVTGMRFLQSSQDADSVSARFEDRRTGGERVVGCRALIGADGILSALRRQFYPGEGLPLYEGITMWRGAAESEPFLDGRTMVILGHHDLKIVVYPIADPAARGGRALINWIAEKRTGISHRDGFGDWNRPATPGEFLADFERYRFDFLDFPKLCRETGRIFVYPMVDREPLPRWTWGRATLLGDSAHPMYPIGANGSSQVMIDAEAIADAIAAQPDDLPAALAAYEAARLAATTKIVHTNRQRGPERILVLARERVTGPHVRVRDVIGDAELDAITQEYRRVAGFDRDELNRKAVVGGAAR